MIVDLFYTIFIFIILVAITLCGARHRKCIDIRDSISRVNMFRGVFALEIVIGHIVRYENTLLKLLGNFMIISVAYFFFVSAIGMVNSYKSKDNYMKSFISSKCLYLFVLAIVVYIFNNIIDIVCPFDLGYACFSGDIFTNFISNTNWYIWELLFFYLLFYFVYRFNIKHKAFLISIVTIFMSIAVFYGGFSIAFYASAFSFPLGIIYGEYYGNINKKVKSKYTVLCSCIFMFVGLVSLMLPQSSIIGMLILRNINCISVMILLMFFVNFIEIKNKAILFLCKYSTEIYLFQFVYLRLMSKIDINYKIKIFVVLAMDILTAIILKPIFEIVRKKLKEINRG